MKIIDKAKGLSSRGIGLGLEIRKSLNAGKYKFGSGVREKSKESVSYIKTRFGYQTTYKLMVHDGFATKFTTNQLIDLLPIDVPENIKVRFSTRERMLRGKGRDKLIENGVNLKYALADFGKKKNNNVTAGSEGNMKSDADAYERLRTHNANPLVIFDWTLIVNAKKKEDIDEYVAKINKEYDKNTVLQGLEWQTVAGKQKELFGSRFGKIDLSYAHRKIVNTDVIKYHSSVPRKYARLNTAFSRGLKYDGGLVIGKDVASPIAETARLDFLKTVKSKAIIAIKNTGSYYDGLSDSSIVLQTIANQFASANVPTLHIVMNGFDYINTDTYLPEKHKKDKFLFEKIVMNEQTINPLEGFQLEGENISTVHHNLVRKVSDIVEIMMNYDIDRDARIELEHAISKFYVTAGKWNTSGSDNGQIHIANIIDHETYPTLADVVSELRTSFLKDGALEKSKGAIDSILKAIDNEVVENKLTIGSTTNIKDPKALQTYYDFSYLKGKSRDLELINVLDYVMFQASKIKGNVMIHGLDSVSSKMMRMLGEFNRYAKANGIPVFIGLDRVMSEVSGEQVFTGVDTLKNVWYNDLTEAEVFAFSRLTNEEFVKMEALLQQKFSTTTKKLMTEDTGFIYYSVYEDRNSGIVHGMPMI